MNEMIEEYFRKEHGTLVKRFTNRAGTSWNAEDVVSEGFARAIKYANSFDPNKKEFGAWMNAILNNALKAFKRDEMNYGMCMEFDEVKEGGSPDGKTVRACKNEIREMIAAEGNPQHVELLTLYYPLNYKPKEIQESLDLSRSTVMTIITRFNKKVKERYEGTGS